MALTTTTTTSASKRVIEETRKLYSNLVLKPIDEKQLVRPSFKFIQDLIKSVSLTSLYYFIYIKNN